jgi:hypothetical protein
MPQIPDELVRRLPIYLAAAVALSTVLAASINAITNWLNDRGQRKWEKEKWLRDHKETAYKECLKWLAESKTIPIDLQGVNHIQVEIFQGHMHSLRYIRAWAAVLHVYSSETSRSQIEDACNHLTDCIQNVWKATIGKDKKDFVPELGLIKAIDDMLDVVVECTKREASIDRSCLLARSWQWLYGVWRRLWTQSLKSS